MQYRLPLLFSAALFGLPRNAQAQPADVEATWTLGAAGGSRIIPGGTEAFGEFDFGGEMTFELTTFGSGPWEFRYGPFINSAMGEGLVAVEGGAKLLFTETTHAQFGTFDLRVGGGHGLIYGLSASHIAITASGGIRWFQNRYQTQPARNFAFGSVVRFMLTARIRPDVIYPLDVCFGLELEPSFLLPPHSVLKWIGAGN
jgi:hypothetical protein